MTDPRQTEHHAFHRPGQFRETCLACARYDPDCGDGAFLEAAMDLRAGLHLPKKPGVHSECACGWKSLGFDAQSHEDEYQKHLGWVAMMDAWGTRSVPRPPTPEPPAHRDGVRPRMMQSRWPKKAGEDTVAWRDEDGDGNPLYPLDSDGCRTPNNTGSCDDKR